MVQPHELTVSSCPVCPLVQRERVLACDLISRVKDRPHLGKIRQYFSGLTTLLWPIINALVVPSGWARCRSFRVLLIAKRRQFDRLPGMAADLVNRKAVVILAGASHVAIRAAMATTKTIPIVFTTASDPVRAGFVTSFGRPGGYATGITFMGVDLVAKRMELLHEVLPGASRIALLVESGAADPSPIAARIVPFLGRANCAPFDGKAALNRDRGDYVNPFTYAVR
jgi:ABC transporter substrate binding protein